MVGGNNRQVAGTLQGSTRVGLQRKVRKRYGRKFTRTSAFSFVSLPPSSVCRIKFKGRQGYNQLCNFASQAVDGFGDQIVCKSTEGSACQATRVPDLRGAFSRLSEQTRTGARKTWIEVATVHGKKSTASTALHVMSCTCTYVCVYAYIRSSPCPFVCHHE